MSENETTGEAPEGKPIIDEKVKQNVKSRSTWLRLLYMLFFVLVLALAEIVLAAVVIVQFFTALLSGERNEKLLKFGADMALYVRDIWSYLAFVTDEQPFPLGEWRRAGSGAPETEA